MIQFAVLPLQVHATRHGLEVPDPRLSFDANDKAEAGDRRIPRTKVASDWQGYFGSPPEVAVDSSAEAPQQDDVRGVANWVTSREKSQRRLEANGSGDPTDRGECHLSARASLEAPHLRARHPCRRTDFSEAEASSNPSLSDFAPGDAKLFGGPTLRTLLGSFARSHGVKRGTQPFTPSYLSGWSAVVTSRVTPDGSRRPSMLVLHHASRPACQSSDETRVVGGSSRLASRSADLDGPIRWLSRQVRTPGANQGSGNRE